MNMHRMFWTGISALTLLGTLAAGPVQANGQPQTGEKHCYVLLGALRPGELTSRMTVGSCYSTYADMVFAATKGAVRLPRDIRPDQVTPEMVQNGVLTKLSTDYVDVSYLGRSLTWWAEDAHGCSDGSAYAQSSMPVIDGFNWNNVISSSRLRSDGGCNSNLHFTSTSFTGTSVDCTCYWMGGSINNDTSSEKWAR